MYDAMQKNTMLWKANSTIFPNGGSNSYRDKWCDHSVICKGKI
jgi:hypothetical protein